MSRDMPWTRFSGRLVLGRSYSDPQEGLSGFLLLADREVSVRAAAAETTTFVDGIILHRFILVEV